MEKIEFVANKLELGDISRLSMFTDIHFGNHQNSTENNEDCLKFVNWFCTKTLANRADAIVFLGDWFENRNAINVLTSQYSKRALELLNNCGIPVIFIIGNHDLYLRHNRLVHSLEIFEKFENIHVIDHPTLIANKLFVPFLFKEEYPQAVNIINKAEYVFGHFEFRNFYLTGTSRVCEHGFHHKLFDGPKYIFSGHYHCRQCNDNIVYIGNPFGTSYADAGDYARGCCFLDSITNKIEFIDYLEGPTYFKTKLSSLLSGEVEPKENARVRCLTDVELSYSEAQALKVEFLSAYKLREFCLEENLVERQHSLAESAIAELDELDLSSLDETIKKLIETGVQSTFINPALLVEIYGEL